MILNPEKLHSFEKRLIKREKIRLSDSFKILDALYKEAVELKVLPPKDPLEGLDTLIKVAKAVNNV